MPGGRRWGYRILVVACLLALGSCWSPGGGAPAAGGPEDVPSRELRPGEAPPESEYWLEPGYKLELVVGRLTYPRMVTFGAGGELYVAEAGYAYGPATSIPRVLRVLRGGGLREVARLPDGPITALSYREGFLYAVGGRAPAAVWRINPTNGHVQTLVSGLPVWGHHFTSAIAFNDDTGKLYFAVGTPSNAGVIGLDDYWTFGYLPLFPTARDIPAVDLQLVGRNFVTENPFTADPDDQATTGAFKPFGTPSQPGELIEAGEPPAVTGAIMRCNPDGTDLELVASGFRNVSGLGFAPDGRLLAIDQGMDNTGSRPVVNDHDSLWEVQYGGWYGFPDYPSGRPISDPSFAPPGKPAPEPLLLAHPPLAAGPYHRFEPAAAAHHFDFSRDRRFGFTGQMFVAQYGSHFSEVTVGHRVVRFDLDSRAVADFYVNLAPGPVGSAPERPIAARFGPDGNLYLVDFGKLAAVPGVFFPSALSGAVWRISPRRTIMTGWVDPRLIAPLLAAGGLALLTLAGLLCGAGEGGSGAFKGVSGRTGRCSRRERSAGAAGRRRKR